MPLSEKDRRIAYGILKHLRSQLDNGAVQGDPAESVEVAIQCLSEAYGVDLSSASQRAKYDVEPTLEELFSKAAPADESAKEKAEAFKQQGNAHLKLNKFQEAVDSYGRAIDLDPTNATYFCNRAAAYIKLQELQKALDDCKQALSLNPTYARAYGRMGYVYSSLNKLEESKDCFKKAIELDPDNENYKSNLETVEEQLRDTAAPGAEKGAGGASQGAQPQPQPQPQPGGGLGGLLGGANLAGLMSNPGFMNMASSVMSNPAFQQMATHMMASGFQGGNVAGMMPDVMQMAQQMQQNNPEMFESMRQQAAANMMNPSQPQQQPDTQQPGSQQAGNQQSGSQQPTSQQSGSQQQPPGSQGGSGGSQGGGTDV